MKSPHNPLWHEKLLELLTTAGVTTDQDMAADLLHSALQLAKDQPGRADMKLMSRSFKELRYAFKIFQRYRNHRKISVFGSARTPPNHPNYLQAKDFGKLAASAGFMVITGAGAGIMAAGHEGAGQSHSFGVAIRLPFEQKTNSIIENDEKLIHFRYFFSRKLVFVKETHAIALFPGGFGTHDEGFEVLTLVQTGRCDPLPIVMIEAPGGTYWQAWDAFVRGQLLRDGLISEEDLGLYFITQDAHAAIAHIEQFYRNYHSLRYDRKRLILRVKQTPTADELAELNHDFADIVRGGIRVQTAEAVAGGDTAIVPEMPRLVFGFDRRSMGRLRQLIDRLNALPSLPPVKAAETSEVGTTTEPDRAVGEIAGEEGVKLVVPGEQSAE